jgi:hypothetical protein
MGASFRVSSHRQTVAAAKWFTPGRPDRRSRAAGWRLLRQPVREEAGDYV